MNLFTLVAKLGLDSSEYEEGLDQANERAGSLGNALKTAMKVGVGAFVTAGSAALNFASDVMQGVKQLSAYGDNIDKTSQKMGMSAQAFQEWGAIMQHSGTSIEVMQMGMKTLATAVESGNEAFQRIGITQEQLASMSQ